MTTLRHVGITVTNIEKSLKFYKDLLGFEVVSDEWEHGDYIDNFSSLKGIMTRIVKMRDSNGGMVELLCYKSHPREADLNYKIIEIGCSHVAFTVDDVDGIYEKLKEEDIHFECLPQLGPGAFAKVAFCRDPSGVLVELVEQLK
tara:strand:+ start:407 stop:838 length:432 start_codon:yes stop_codon:yes gene_type:complete